MTGVERVKEEERRSSMLFGAGFASRNNVNRKRQLDLSIHSEDDTNNSSFDVINKPKRSKYNQEGLGRKIADWVTKGKRAFNQTFFMLPIKRLLSPGNRLHDSVQFFVPSILSPDRQSLPKQPDFNCSNMTSSVKPGHKFAFGQKYSRSPGSRGGFTSQPTLPDASGQRPGISSIPISQSKSSNRFDSSTVPRTTISDFSYRPTPSRQPSSSLRQQPSSLYDKVYRKPSKRGRIRRTGAKAPLTINQGINIEAHGRYKQLIQQVSSVNLNSYQNPRLTVFPITQTPRSPLDISAETRQVLKDRSDSVSIVSSSKHSYPLSCKPPENCTLQKQRMTPTKRLTDVTRFPWDGTIEQSLPPQPAADSAGKRNVGVEVVDIEHCSDKVKKDGITIDLTADDDDDDDDDDDVDDDDEIKELKTSSAFLHGTKIESQHQAFFRRLLDASKSKSLSYFTHMQERSDIDKNCEEQERIIEFKSSVANEKRKEQLKGLHHQLRDKLSIEDVLVVETVESSSEDEEEDDVDFIELTSEMDDVIDLALRAKPSDEELVRAFRIGIRRVDIQTLKGLNWLNDEVINFYMNLLIERGKLDNYPTVHAFNTFFYPKYMGSGYSTILARWTKNVDISSMDYIVIPVHLGVHWCVCVASFKQKSIKYYDSMGGENNACLQAVRRYISEEIRNKKKIDYDTSDWKLMNVKGIPQQMNGSDCGMFSCKFADYVVRDKAINFTQAHMPYFRRRMIYEILNKRLLS
ncbi:uncharacterized protein LOC141912203 isoform X2 [Tubulanus polymorphus]|uniref:uncharacterized protein LOC141912203 isoform X2 n=1 Tax=Tubulanus polymorphus TaxID=672921 RepID=UPI003DA5F38F